jgi:hypothetical protein
MARYRGVLIAWLAILTALGQFAAASAAPPVMLAVAAAHGLPGFHHSALSRFIAAQMNEAGLADWRFAPAPGSGVPADCVEWSFKLNPYAGGGVRSFVHSLNHEEGFGEGRPVTIEARLYLGGQYQTLVEQQATVRGGPDDPDLASAVVSATRNLLGPTGAYRAIDMGQYPVDRDK